MVLVSQQQAGCWLALPRCVPALAAERPMLLLLCASHQQQGSLHPLGWMDYWFAVFVHVDIFKILQLIQCANDLGNKEHDCFYITLTL